MTISATETSLTLTGPESAIASLWIDGDVIDFTAYDGTLASVTAGTPYTLTLDGFSVQDDAFYGPQDVFGKGNSIVYKDSGRALYSTPLKTSKSDSYSLDISDWIGGDVIETSLVESEEITVLAMEINTGDSVISVILEGESQGRWPVHFSFTTGAGLSGCMTGYIDVLDC